MVFMYNYSEDFICKNNLIKMTLEEEKLSQNQWVRWLLNENHKAELWKILSIWEKYRKEWEKMKYEFWKNKNKRDHFRYLLLGYQLSKDNFMEWLPQEEKEVLNSLNDIAKEKFYEEYSYDKILYGWKMLWIFPKTVAYNDWQNGGLKSLKDWAGKLKEEMQPWMRIGLDNNFFWDEWIEVLAEEWKYSLKPWMKIEFQHNKISAEWVEVLAKEWKNKLQTWMEIFLSSNYIWAAWAEALAKEWKDSLQLWIRIDLQLNDIWAEWVDVLAREWKDSLKSWMSIELGYNEIWAVWAEALAKEWKDSLQPGMSIDLSSNKIWAEWAQAIIENLELKEWVTLDLKWNDIPEEWKDKLKSRAQWYKDNWINCEVQI